MKRCAQRARQDPTIDQKAHIFSGEDSIQNSNDANNQSQESTNLLFTKYEKTDIVIFIKTLMADGNLMSDENLFKLTCNIANGDRITRVWNSFIRCSTIIAFSKSIHELNAPIRSRSLCFLREKTTSNIDQYEDFTANPSNLN
jgi:hypothetical protein